MPTSILVQIDAERLPTNTALEQIEAVAYASGLSGPPFPENRLLTKKSYRNPADIKQRVWASDPEVVCTVRVINVRNINLSPLLRSAVNARARGIAGQSATNRAIESVLRFHLENRTGLFSNILSWETHIGAAPIGGESASDFDISVSFDLFGNDLLAFRKKIDNLIEQSSDLNTQKHAFEALEKVLQKQFANVGREVSVIAEEVHSFRESSQDNFIRIDDKLSALQKTQTEILETQTEILRRLPPPDVK